MVQTSIIIRTLNEERHIGNILVAISEQEYKDYEIIVVDSGSSDKTLEVAQKFPVKVIKIDGRDFTFGYSLNIGCRASSGKYLVFVSAHVLPTDKHWLGNLIKPFTDKKVAMAYGRQRGTNVSKFSEQRDFEYLFRDDVLNWNVVSDYANNANSAVRKSLWNERPFDEFLFGLEDVEWAKAMVQKGFSIFYEPTASVYHIHEEKWHQVFNRYRREAIAAYRIGLKHPPQARTHFFWLIQRLSGDLLLTFPDYSSSRLDEILRFRYYQWKGSRQGWFKDRNIDLDRDKYELSFPRENHAVVIYGKRKAGIKELPLPKTKPGDILIQISHVGICKTDLEVYEGSLGYYKNGPAKYPIIPGHEFSGTIVKIGASPRFRERFKVGEAVVGECIMTREVGKERKEVGVVNYNGAYSKLIVMPGDMIHKVPEGLSLDVACLAEPLAVVLRALRRSGNRLHSKSEIAVVGAGPIGNLFAQVLSSYGHYVSLFDKREDRLLLLKNGVKKTYTSFEKIKDFGIIVEATGSKEVLDELLRVSGNDTTFIVIGFPYGKTEYNFEDLVGKEKVLIGSVGAEWEDFENALEMLPKLETKVFTENIYALEDYEKAWDSLREGKKFKILIKP
ncbi:MAG: glycosyltransferase [Candidatus Vogelbacteria bacterium]|nr:glycosyltransferase [Candidatus Vogelbacteria bacterium]